MGAAANGVASIERLLDTVDWTDLPEVEDEDGLYAVREGTLEIGVARFKVYVLNDGQRVFDADSVAEFMAPPSIPDGRE